ncbi:M23 family metallopeptidase [Candidatus Dependentiae bacterium]|nr:M23 family metallopeptidase [Candidatus Dependentiae bacterium]
MIKNFILLLLFIITIIISGCAVKRGGYHYQVKAGETINQISQKVNIPGDLIMKSNNISDPTKLRAGKLIFIPVYKPGSSADIKESPKNKNISSETKKDIKQPVKTKKQKTDKNKNSISKNKEKTKQPSVIKDFDFTWPAAGKVITFFSPLTRGLTIEVEENSDIKTAGPGVVIYTDNLKGYGNSVIIKHNEKYMTVYTYLKEVTVKPEQPVKSGEIIGKAGINDTAPDFDKPVIHFEIRQSEGGNPVAVNPLLFLD